MFRKPTKNPEHENIYSEEKMMHPYKYPMKEGKEEMPPRVFEPQAHPNFKPQHKDFFAEKNNVPHHFQEIIKEEVPETTLGEGVKVKGTLEFERLLRIDGIFEGELLSQGKVIIGPKGEVTADLHLKRATIEGKVHGNINCEERVELKGHAEVHGDIKTKSLVIDEGVIIVGHVEILAPKPTEEKLAKS